MNFIMGSWSKNLGFLVLWSSPKVVDKDKADIDIRRWGRPWPLLQMLQVIIPRLSSYLVKYDPLGKEYDLPPQAIGYDD